MAEDMKIGEAYLLLTTKGDVTADVERSKSEGDSANAKQEQARKNRKAAIDADYADRQRQEFNLQQQHERTENKRHQAEDAATTKRAKRLHEDRHASEPPERKPHKMTRDVFGLEGEGYGLQKDPGKHGQEVIAWENKIADRREQLRQQRESREKDDEKRREREARQTEKAQREIDANYKSEVQQQKVADMLALGAKTQRASAAASFVGGAFGAIPGAHAAAGIAQQGVYGYQQAAAKKITEGGTKEESHLAGVRGAASGVAIATAVTAIATGIQGAMKANPQTAENLNYQADRFQAALGQSFVPLLEAASRGLEKFNDLIGAAPLNQPRYSKFEDIRDRLQIAALQGSASGGAGGRDRFEYTKAGAIAGATIGSVIPGVGTVAGAVAGTVAGGVIDAKRGLMNAIHPS